ncbi:MAG: MFS transporter, partial [Rhodobacteraceae bacterium]|nr:MFS transporter [Paracoccaceae bacterium]
MTNQSDGKSDDSVLPTDVAFGWGLGTLGIAALFNAVNVLALNYMTNVLGIGAAVAGLMIAASKIYDAVTDPLMGVISDRVSHRLGRRRPFLLIGGGCLAVGALVLFSIPAIVPPEAVTWYMGFALIFYATAYTVYNVPYMAMPAEMTDSYHERTRLISYRVQNVAVANITANAAGPAVIASFASAAMGHAFLGMILAVVVL